VAHPHFPPLQLHESRPLMLAMLPLKTISVLLPFLIKASVAADCYQPRSSSSPGGTDLANFIQSNLAAACLAISFNVTGTASTHLDDYYILSNYTATNEAPIVAPNNFTLCAAALQQIVQQCILDQDSYGGDFVLYEQTYNITNNVFPSNPISQTSSSTTTPGPTLAPAPSTSTSSTSSSTTSTAGPVATAAEGSSFQLSLSQFQRVQKSRDKTHFLVIPWVEFRTSEDPI
jgi:hypothetical protein